LLSYSVKHGYINFNNKKCPAGNILQDIFNKAKRQKTNNVFYTSYRPMTGQDLNLHLQTLLFAAQTE